MFDVADHLLLFALFRLVVRQALGKRPRREDKKRKEKKKKKEKIKTNLNRA
jgi:hypothetical protein